jgi:ketosteroid isomerase-like protein
MNSLATFNKETVEQFAHTFEELFYNGDGIGMGAYYTENARLFADGVAPIHGKPAIEAFWQETCEHGKVLNMKRSIRVDDVQATDELCYAYSTLTLDLTTGDQAIHRTVSDITIWRRQVSGTWQIEVDISVPDPQKEQTN